MRRVVTPTGVWGTGNPHGSHHLAQCDAHGRVGNRTQCVSYGQIQPSRPRACGEPYEALVRIGFDTVTPTGVWGTGEVGRKWHRYQSHAHGRVGNRAARTPHRATCGSRPRACGEPGRDRLRDAPDGVTPTGVWGNRVTATLSVECPSVTPTGVWGTGRHGPHTGRRVGHAHGRVGNRAETVYGTPLTVSRPRACGEPGMARPLDGQVLAA